MTTDSPQPRTRGHSVIQSGDGKRILLEYDNDQNRKSSSTTYGGDGRVLFTSKDKDKDKE